jgi:catechol 2,3-dioxygenase-like lactoylglutathione lyase family enzyme
MPAQLEHVNYTVSDCHATAAWICDVFGWQIRWQGPSLNGGHTIHVGTPDAYVALYTHGTPTASTEDNYATTGGLNHIAVTVNDLDAAEKRVIAAGFTPTSHADYEPGRRFYFHDHDGIEYEVVSYNS